MIGTDYDMTTLCLAALESSNGHFLFVVGGRSFIDLASTFIDYTKVLNISSNEWSDGPEMNTERAYHACISNANQDALYSIGGWIYSADADYGFIVLDSVEILNVSDIQNLNSFEWIMLSNTLSTGLWKHRVIRDGRYLLTVGGEDHGSNKVSEMNIIDTVTNSIFVSGHLDQAMLGTAVVNTGTMVYAFGGYMVYHDFMAESISTWRYLLKLSVSPCVYKVL